MLLLCCRHRRNLVTLSEITKLYVTIVFYVHLESTVFLLMYNFQDSVGPDNVFYIVHTVYAVFDIFIVVCDLSLKRDRIFILTIRWLFTTAFKRS